jgi:hypothetical protein
MGGGAEEATDIRQLYLQYLQLQSFDAMPMA